MATVLIFTSAEQRGEYAKEHTEMVARQAEKIKKLLDAEIVKYARF